MEYQQLNLSAFETRFLRILGPSPSTSFIRAAVVTASLRQAPKYSALSYTWGDEPPTECIQIDGRDVPVAKNVEAALKELHLPEGTLIWIDALCINQRDHYEKSCQVNIMGEIYARADTVIAWLGEAKADTEQATDLLTSVGEVLRRESEGSSNKTKAGKRCLASAIRTSDDPSRALRGLVDLLTRPFWERVWIIQEIAKAKRVIVRCGRFQTSLEPIWRVFNHVPRIGTKAKDLLDAIKQFRSSEQNIHRERIALLDALFITKRSQATEPRDRVYALLSLTTDGRELVPLPDYDTPLESVFDELSIRILTRSRRLAVMLLAARTSSSWQSMGVDVRSRLAVQWTELHEYVPRWVMRSVLEPEKTSSQYTLQAQNKQVKTSAAFIGKIVDCENRPSETDPDASKELEDNIDRSARISDTVDACREDVLHICAELSSSGRAKVDSDECTLESFAHQLRKYRRTERENREAGTIVSNLLLSPLQRLGPLQYRDRKLWSLARLYEQEGRRRRSGSVGSDSSVGSSARSVLSMSTDEASPWNEVEAQLEEDTVFGMQFGVVEREVSINYSKYSSFLSTISPGNVYSGIGFLCKEAQPGDMLFQLPGIRHPVVLRSTASERYLLLGECILRVENRKGSMKDICIATKN